MRISAEMRLFEQYHSNSNIWRQELPTGTADGIDASTQQYLLLEVKKSGEEK